MAISSQWPRGDPRDVARAILSDPRYAQGSAPSPRASWFEIASGWIADALRALLHGLDRMLGSRNPVEAAIGFTVIAAALALLAFGSYVLVRSYAGGGRARPRASAGGSSAAVERTSLELRAAALAAARAGRDREAAALLFLSAVRALDERGRVAYDPARTPEEYRRLVRDPLFDALASDAVVAIFAAAEPPGDLFERMRAAYDRFLGAPAR